MSESKFVCGWNRKIRCMDSFLASGTWLCNQQDEPPCEHRQVEPEKRLLAEDYESAKHPVKTVEPLETIKISFENHDAVEALFRNDKRLSVLENKVSALQQRLAKVEIKEN